MPDRNHPHTTKERAPGKLKPDQWRCFTIVNRKIAPPLSCELNAVDHCNITCLDCNHASPAFSAFCADPDVVYNDFSRLAKVYHANFVKILGGEPLLHPDLPSLITAIRKSKISDKIWLVTNGTLIHLMSDSLWREIDKMEVSLYPMTDLPEEKLNFLRHKALEHHVTLSQNFYQYFRMTFSLVGTDDDALVRRIFRSCKLANLWGCQSISQGHFFKCPQSIYIPRILDFDSAYPNTEDGLKIQDTSSFHNDLADYLSSSVPLKACRYCLGCVGKLRPHRFCQKKEWKRAHQNPTEKAIDFDKLKRIESGQKNPYFDAINLNDPTTTKHSHWPYFKKMAKRLLFSKKPDTLG